MIRHAPEAAAFPVGPLPVAVIEPSLPALLVSPVGSPPLLPPRFFPAAVAAVLVPPVTMTTDPEHHATAGPPAKPLTQWLFAGPHRRPCGGRGQPRLGLAISTPSADALFTLRGAERAPLLPGEHGRIKPMQRKRGGLVPIGEVFSDLSGPQSRRPVELADLLAEDYREPAAVSSGG